MILWDLLSKYVLHFNFWLLKSQLDSWDRTTKPYVCCLRAFLMITYILTWLRFHSQTSEWIIPSDKASLTARRLGGMSFVKLRFSLVGSLLLGHSHLLTSLRPCYDVHCGWWVGYNVLVPKLPLLDNPKVLIVKKKKKKDKREIF